MTSNAVRVARCRARQAAGELVVTLVLPEVEVADMLVRGNWLAPWEVDDRATLNQALRQFIIDATRA